MNSSTGAASAAETIVVLQRLALNLAAADAADLLLPIMTDV